MRIKMKCFCFLLFTGCLATTTKAQQSEPALARVLYEFTHINDTLQPDKPHKEEMVLYIGQHASLYGSNTGEQINQQIQKQLEDPSFDGNLTITGSGRTTQESYYAKPGTQAFKQLSRVAGETYLVDKDYPAIDWHVSDETKEIGGYTAQRATGRFKGREYTAWFTTEVPFQAGPWKLQGLPGLILEAEDSREEVVFRYAGFETFEESEAAVLLPDNAIPTTQKALDKLVEAYKRNPQAAHNARSQGTATAGGGSGRPVVRVGAGGGNAMASIDPSRIKSVNVKKDNTQISPVDNNPLELEDNR
ncbi:GLPGLI family protein [Parapedobacter sp. ISTM3]|uniref:GLPGLI family protein n=1 Tax=Parapedobacter sp. ISTM3 TaxID=2800130 RepID=UPI00351C7554